MMGVLAKFLWLKTNPLGHTVLYVYCNYAERKISYEINQTLQGNEVPCQNKGWIMISRG